MHNNVLKVDMLDRVLKEDNVAVLLMKTPPDWDLAEKYGRANMCVDSAKQVLDLE